MVARIIGPFGKNTMQRLSDAVAVKTLGPLVRFYFDEDVIDGKPRKGAHVWTRGFDLRGGETLVIEEDEPQSITRTNWNGETLVRKILWPDVVTYILIPQTDTIKRCSNVIEATDKSPNYYLTAEGDTKTYRTDHIWGRHGGEEYGMVLWFCPLTDARIREANAKFEELIRKHRGNAS